MEYVKYWFDGQDEKFETQTIGEKSGNQIEIMLALCNIEHSQQRKSVLFMGWLKQVRGGLYSWMS